MKISVFSEIFSTAPDTIRFYVNEGLLIPHTKNNRYDFNDEDKKDMELLLRLKSYHFSLHDIHRILSLKRLSNFDSSDDLGDYILILKEQKRKMLNEKKNLDRILEGIDQELYFASQKQNSEIGKRSGIPLLFLSFLACPDCQSMLTLENCTIENQEIQTGSLKCSCGYHALIKDGIIIGNTGPVSPHDGVDTERNCYRMMSPELLSLIQKSYLWMCEQLSSCDTSGRIILEDCINNYCFCYSNFTSLNPDSLYIITDKYEAIVRTYKSLIEKQNLKRNILYIAAGSSQLPIRQACVDYYIDFDSSNEYAILYNHYAFQTANKYLSSQAKYLGVFSHFSSAGPSMKELYSQYPKAWKHSFDSSYFKKFLYETWEYAAYEDEFGFVTDSGYGESFSYHIKKEPLWLSPFFCRNKKK